MILVRYSMYIQYGRQPFVAPTIGRKFLNFRSSCCECLNVYHYNFCEGDPRGPMAHGSLLEPGEKNLYTVSLINGFSPRPTSPYVTSYVLFIHNMQISIK